MSKSDFSGYWRITHTSVWDQEAMDLVAPAHLSFSDRRGSLSMIAIEASLECRYEGKRVAFSLFGADEYDPIAGRGWATINEAGKMGGMLCTSTTAMKPSSRPRRPSLRRHVSQSWSRGEDAGSP